MKPEEQLLLSEIEVRLKDVHRAISRGEPPARWKARRMEIDDLYGQLLMLQAVLAHGSLPSPEDCRAAA